MAARQVPCSCSFHERGNANCVQPSVSVIVTVSLVGTRKGFVHVSKQLQLPLPMRGPGDQSSTNDTSKFLHLSSSLGIIAVDAKAGEVQRGE